MGLGCGVERVLVVLPQLAVRWHVGQTLAPVVRWVLRSRGLVVFVRAGRNALHRLRRSSGCKCGGVVVR